jgi:hypothetical protein
MHNDGKLSNLGGFTYPPNCLPNHKKIAPPKNSADARIPEEIGPSRVASSHVSSIWYGATTDAGRRSFDKGGRSNEWTLLWDYGVIPFVTFRPHAENGAGAPVLPPSAESDRAATHVTSPAGCGTAADAWGSVSDAGMGSNGGPSWWGVD